MLVLVLVLVLVLIGVAHESLEAKQPLLRSYDDVGPFAQHYGAMVPKEAKLWLQILLVLLLLLFVSRCS